MAYHMKGKDAMMLKKTSVKLMACLLTLTMLAALGGCPRTVVVGAAQINKANYDKIQDGMTENEVVAILGKGHSRNYSSTTKGGVRTSSNVMTWRNGDISITVTFKDDKVVGKTQIGL